MIQVRRWSLQSHSVLEIKKGKGMSLWPDPPPHPPTCLRQSVVGSIQPPGLKSCTELTLLAVVLSLGTLWVCSVQLPRRLRPTKQNTTK